MKTMTKEEIIANPRKAIRSLIKLIKNPELSSRDTNFCLCYAMYDLLGDDFNENGDNREQKILAKIGITYKDVCKLTPKLASRNIFNEFYQLPAFWFEEHQNPKPRITYLNKKLKQLKNVKVDC